MERPTFAGPSVDGVAAKAEGPTIIRHGEGWLIYCDYWETEGNGVFFTRDFESIENITDRTSFPQWVRHGTVLPIDAETLAALRAR